MSQVCVGKKLKWLTRFAFPTSGKVNSTNQCWGGMDVDSDINRERP